MQRKSFAAIECPIARSLDEGGDAWTLLILRNALLGAKRFQEFQQQLAIAPNTLARRLESMTCLGLLERHIYERHPVREEYELTAKGEDLLPVLLALSAWGNHWLSPSGAPLETVDPDSGERIEPVVVDRRTQRRLSAGTGALRAGPRPNRTRPHAHAARERFGPFPTPPRP